MMIKLLSLKPKRLHGDSALFVFAFFTCKRDFEDIKYALLSLKYIDLKYKKRIHIIIDRSNKLSQQQIDKLRTCIDEEIVFSQTEYTNRKGPRRIISELLSFQQVIQNMSINSYLVKCDSDIVFCSSYVFDQVLELQADLIGQPIYFHTKHTQGGCYFLSYNILTKILQCNISNALKKTCKLKNNRPLSYCPEDAFFTT